MRVFAHVKHVARGDPDSGHHKIADRPINVEMYSRPCLHLYSLYHSPQSALLSIKLRKLALPSVFTLVAELVRSGLAVP